MNENERIPQDYIQEIIDLLRSGDEAEVLHEKLDEYHANDLASALPLYWTMNASVKSWNTLSTAIFT